MRKNGILIGRVKSIEDLEDGIIVQAFIDGNRPLYPVYQPHVHTNALGDATIDFVTQPLPAGSQPVEVGHTFTGVVDPNPFDALAQLGDLKKDFSDAAQSLNEAGKEVGELAKRVNKAFGSEAGEEGRVSRLMDKTEAAMEQFGRTMRAFNEILGDEPVGARQPGVPRPPVNTQPFNVRPPAGVRTLAGQPVSVMQRPNAQPPAAIPPAVEPRPSRDQVNIELQVEGPELRRRIRQGLNELPDAIREVRDSMQHFNRTLDLADKNFRNLEGFTEPLGQKGQQITDAIFKVVDGIDRLVEDVKVLVNALNSREGTFGQLLHDRQVYDNFNQLMCNANQVLTQVYDLTRQLRPIVNDVRVFTDKIAREPGRVISGAVNPSVVK